VNALGQLILLVCRLAIAALFLFAAYQKLFASSDAPQKFALAINSFKILPEHLVHLAAGAIPWIEVVCGLLLIVGIWTRAAAALLAAMLIAFTIAVASVLLRDMSLTCGCFGKFSLICAHDKMSWCKIGENAIILVPTLLVAIFGGGFFDLDRNTCKTGPVSGPLPPSTPSPSKA
jgi:uncharacterized membrane protein YphA (DoxX/SURF4 family)